MHNLLLLGALVLPVACMAAPPARGSVIKPVEQLADQKSVDKHFRSLGFRRSGGVSRARSDHDGDSGHSFPTFTSSFTVGGKVYPFTMVGHAPQSGRSSEIRSVIIPLRVNFFYFGANQDVSASLDPARAVTSIVGSPMFVPAQFPNGYGQFIDQLQRAAFWNRMDAHHQWHVRMAAPSVLPTVDLYVTPETGNLFTNPYGVLLGDLLFDFVDSQARTILQFLGLPSDVLPIFVTENVTAEAWGYHAAYEVPDGRGGTRVQTYVYASWLDLGHFYAVLGDVFTFSHELAEWVNDPYLNNIVPTWAYPPVTDPNSSCSFNPYLEVGDPQSNGGTEADFPTVPVTLAGVTYHVQQLVLWQWFADEVPSSAYGGWYTFPLPTSITTPATYCQ